MMGERMCSGGLRTSRSSACPSAEDVYLFHGVARANPRDERLFAIAEVRDLTPLRDDDGRVVGLPELERMVVEAFEGIRIVQAHRKPSRRLHWNRLLLYVWPEMIDLSTEEIAAMMARYTPDRDRARARDGADHGRMRDADGSVRPRVLRFFAPAGSEVVVEVDDPPDRPLEPLDEGARRIIAARRRGLAHPAEIVKSLRAARRGREAGSFVEHDLDDDGRLAPVDASAVHNPAGVVVGVVRNATDRYPEGMLRVAMLGRPDPRARLARRARVPAHHRRARPRRAARRARGVVRAVGGSEDRHGQRHREHGLDRRGAAPDRRVHAGRRRDQRRRDRDQRRRPALLERRGHDAHAHPRHPRHDADAARWS